NSLARSTSETGMMTTSSLMSTFARLVALVGSLLIALKVAIVSSLYFPLDRPDRRPRPPHPVTQRLRTFVFASHHCTDCWPCFSGSALTVRPGAPTRPDRAGDQNGRSHVPPFLPYLRSHGVKLGFSLARAVALL